MADLEIFQNGNWSNGDPVYQIGSKNADGSYDVKDAGLMTKAEAEAKLAKLQPTAKPKPAAKKPAAKKTTKK